MKIMGGPFSEIPLLAKGDVDNEDFFDGCIWVNSGRYALKKILVNIKNEMDIQQIHIPSYYCNSLGDIIYDAGFQIVYYDVNKSDDGIDIMIEDYNKVKLMLYMNYYGFQNNKNIKTLLQVKKHGGLIIEDLTHSLLSDNWFKDADYYFASLRKWTGIKTGGFYKGINVVCNYGEKESVNYFHKNVLDSFIDDYTKYLYSGIGNRGYFKDKFWESEMAIDSYPNNIAIIQSDIDGIRNWDINYVKAKRRENAEIIINTLNKDVLVYDSLNSSDVPFFVPIFLPGDARMKLCEMLDKNNIFCSILWGRPDGYRGTCNMYDADFGLVCDERYNTTQIHNMVGLINGCLEEFDLRCV